MKTKNLTILGIILSSLLMTSCRSSNVMEMELENNLPPLGGAMKCGAFVAPGKWKEFACQNLGADPNVNPFEAVAGNFGAKYQWGAFTNEAGRYVSQYDDQVTYNNHGPVAGWIGFTSNQAVQENAKPDDAWKTNDPCKADLGAGWRVPTKEEWEGVWKYNTATEVGQFSDSDNELDNFNAGVKLGDKLFLPATGYRNNTKGILKARGYNGYYWSSISKHNPGSWALSYYDAHYSSFGSIILGNTSRTYAYSIRCIKD